MGRNWAITIGINDYYNLQPLRYAVRDGTAMGDLFRQELGFEQVYHFADDAPPIETDRGPLRSQPTFGNLKRFFRERFKQPFLDNGDTLWLFFAGHGELYQGHDYLLPQDGDPGNLEETALRISDLTAYLRNSGADNTVMLLDACRSQGRRQGVGLGTETQPGMVTVYSCSPQEASYEVEDLGHGTFTYALLEGLGRSGTNNCATVERLDQHLRYRVPELNRQYGKPVQTPYTALEPLSKNHLILLPQRASRQDVLPLLADAQAAELEGDLALAEQLWIRVLAAAPADRDAVAALKRIALKQASAPAPGQPSTDSRQSRLHFSFEVVTVNPQGQILDRQQASAPYQTVDLGQGVTLDMVLIPGGSFMMGSPDSEPDRFSDESPQHQVTLPGFWMGKYSITQAQYQAIMGNNPANFKGDNRPVEQVNWHEAMEFCDRLSQKLGQPYTLPGEAQWEYACRAATTTPFYLGETITTDLANYRGTDSEYEGKTYPGFYGQGPRGAFREQTTEVGSFPPNGFGLYDMHGNVWEWCLDHFHDSYNGAPADGSAWVTGGDSQFRLVRGGSWYLDPVGCRSAYRLRILPNVRDYGLGFRVVCAPPGLL
jgi:formylglycine-generating enzyme required for sulfatase activity